MSLVFSLDSTSGNNSITICDEEKIIAEYNFSYEQSLSSTLIPYIDFILKNLKLSISDFDVFGICTGPGFFTGIRVGLSTLSGLLFGMERPIVAVTSLEAVAMKFRGRGTSIVPLIDARREEVYMAKYFPSKENGLLSEELAPLITGVSDIRKFLSADKDYIFSGSGATVYKDNISNIFTFSHFEKRSPFLSFEISQVALLKFRSGKYLKGAKNLLPLYIRKPDAEKNFK